MSSKQLASKPSNLRRATDAIHAATFKTFEATVTLQLSGCERTLDFTSRPCTGNNDKVEGHINAGIVFMALGDATDTKVEPEVAKRSGMLQDLLHAATGAGHIPISAEQMRRWLMHVQAAEYMSDCDGAEAKWQPLKRPDGVQSPASTEWQSECLSEMRHCLIVRLQHVVKLQYMHILVECKTGADVS